jgi:hypothetical protein
MRAIAFAQLCLLSRALESILQFWKARLFGRFILIVVAVFIVAIFAHSTAARPILGNIKQPKIIVISIGLV